METITNEPDGEIDQSGHSVFLSNILTSTVFTASSAMPFLVCFCNTGAVYHRDIKITVMSIFINASVLVFVKNVHYAF